MPSDTMDQSVPPTGVPRPHTETLLAAIVLAALSERLMFDGPVGLSLLLVALLTGAAALFLHRKVAGRARQILAAGLYGLGLLPVLENISLLSVAVMLTLFAIASLMLADGLRGTLNEKIRQLIWFAASVPVSAPIGVLGWKRARTGAGGTMIAFAHIGVWLMPLGVGLVFLALFQEANPVIADWLKQLDFWAIFNLLDPARLIFAASAFVITWAFLQPHVHKLNPARKRSADTASLSTGATASADQTLAGVLFGEAAILRSLIVFNLMFAVETLLDLAYLSGGAVLPQGMTYASYAHRGAYPLIVTALLAALFVLLALRSGSAARTNRLIRSLVYLWIGQNIALVGSSIFRLDLYVGEYGLTYWRIAAFMWMGLVACGLGFIVWRIVADKSASWLIGANLTTVSLALYVSCFVNFAGSIAASNVVHERQDFWYLASLGEQAIPAIDKAIVAGLTDSAQVWAPDEYGRYGEQGSVLQWRLATAKQFSTQYADWRSFTLRKWRLSRYLADNPMHVTVLHGRVPEIRP